MRYNATGKIEWEIIGNYSGMYTHIFVYFFLGRLWLHHVLFFKYL